MPRTRNPYPAEFREQIVALAQTGRSVEEERGSTLTTVSGRRRLFQLESLPDQREVSLLVLDRPTLDPVIRPYLSV